MTKQVRVEGAGSVERLTIAAMVDLSAADASGTKSGNPPLTLPEAEEIIKKAVGFKQVRGDEIKVTDVKLAAPPALTSLDTEWTENLALAELCESGKERFARSSGPGGTAVRLVVPQADAANDRSGDGTCTTAAGR